MLEIKEGTVITPEELEENGWKNSLQKFSTDEIWKKGEGWLLYDRENKKVGKIVE
jgi:hypothetical protein